MDYRSSIERFRTNPNSEPSHVYYNATIINNNAEETGALADDPNIYFSETRDTAIIKNSGAYEFSIVRFSLNGCGVDIPLFVPIVQLNQTAPGNVNLTEYTVNIQATVINGAYPGGVSTLPATTETDVLWIPEAQTAPVPTASTVEVGGTGQDLSTRYYYASTFSHVVDLINTALTTSHASLVAYFAGLAPPVVITTTAPQLRYDEESGLFVFYCDRFGYGGTSRTSAGGLQDENFTLYMNTNLYNLLSTFPTLRAGLSNSRTYALDVRNRFWTNIYNPVQPTLAAGLWVQSAQVPSNVGYWEVKQNYKSTSSFWSPVESIVFTSARIPIVKEDTGEPLRFGQSNNGIASTSQSAFIGIITDITQAGAENGFDYQTQTVYVPQGEYRMASLNGTGEIRDLDIGVFWKNRLDGKLYPIRMPNLSSVSIKMLFRRKDWSG